MKPHLFHRYYSASPGQSSVCSAPLQCRWTLDCCCVTGCSPHSGMPCPDAAGPILDVAAASPAPVKTPHPQTIRGQSLPGCPGSLISPMGPSSELCGSLEVQKAGDRWTTCDCPEPSDGGWEAEVLVHRSSRVYR